MAQTHPDFLPELRQAVSYPHGYNPETDIFVSVSEVPETTLGFSNSPAGFLGLDIQGHSCYDFLQ